MLNKLNASAEIDLSIKVNTWKATWSDVVVALRVTLGLYGLNTQTSD